MGQLNQMDMVRNAPQTVGELDDVCNVRALAKVTKTSLSRMAETQAEEKLERVFTDVMGPFRVESLSRFRFCIVFADQYTKFVGTPLWGRSQCGDAQEAETRQCEGVSLRAVQDVLMQVFYRRRPYQRRHNRMG